MFIFKMLNRKAQTIKPYFRDEKYKEGLQYLNI